MVVSGIERASDRGPVGYLRHRYSTADVGSGASQVGAWADRGSGSDGDWMILTSTGASFRYSAVAADWVRPWVFDTVTVANRIPGGVAPSAVLPNPWTDVQAPAPPPTIITSDGTRVTWDTVGSTYAYSEFATGGAGNQWVTGRFAVSGETGAGVTAKFSRYIAIYTGARLVAATLSATNADKIAMLAETTGNEVGVRLQTVAYQTESWMELFVDATAVTMYHDHGAQPCSVALLSSFGASGVAHGFLIGDGTGTGTATTTGRDILCGGY